MEQTATPDTIEMDTIATVEEMIDNQVKDSLNKHAHLQFMGLLSFAEFQKTVDPIVKDSTNPFFKSKYSSLPSILGIVTPALREHGLVVLQAVENDPGLGPVVKSCLYYNDLQTGSSTLIEESSYPIVVSKPNDPQAFGAGVTYARRYDLLTILGLAPEDDDGNQANDRYPKEAPKKASIAPDGDLVACEYKDGCDNLVSPGWAKSSRSKYGKVLCADHRKVADEVLANKEAA